jgi:hypothetical protein
MYFLVMFLIMNHKCMVMNNLENFKFQQCLSNVISRLIYMALGMNLLIFSDMNISTKRLYSVHEMYLCTPLTPQNFI